MKQGRMERKTRLKECQEERRGGNKTKGIDGRKEKKREDKSEEEGGNGGWGGKCQLISQGEIPRLSLDLT